MMKQTAKMNGVCAGCKSLGLTKASGKFNVQLIFNEHLLNIQLDCPPPERHPYCQVWALFYDDDDDEEDDENVV